MRLRVISPAVDVPARQAAQSAESIIANTPGSLAMADGDFHGSRCGDDNAITGNAHTFQVAITSFALKAHAIGQPNGRAQGRF